MLLLEFCMAWSARRLACQRRWRKIAGRTGLSGESKRKVFQPSFDIYRSVVLRAHCSMSFYKNSFWVFESFKRHFPSGEDGEDVTVQTGRDAIIYIPKHSIGLVEDCHPIDPFSTTPMYSTNMYKYACPMQCLGFAEHGSNVVHSPKVGSRLQDASRKHREQVIYPSHLRSCISPAQVLVFGPRLRMFILSQKHLKPI